VGIIFIVIGTSLAIGGVLTITGEPSGNTVNKHSGDVYTSPTFNFSNNMVLITYFPHFSKGVFFEFHSGLNSSSDMPINDNISPCISEISV
jgi:hypothetical protein